MLKKLLVLGGLALVASALTVPALATDTTGAVVAATKKAKPAKTHFGGKVTKVDSSSITIEHGKKKVAHTFTINGNTKISVNGVNGKATTDISIGNHAKIATDSTGQTATEIDVKTKVKHPKKGGTTSAGSATSATTTL